MYFRIENEVLYTAVPTHSHSLDGATSDATISKSLVSYLSKALAIRVGQTHLE